MKETDPPKKSVPLLRQLDVPIEHLDYSYVENCDDVREIEKILRVLRSGEEGHYEDFQQYVENRLKVLNPSSRFLRKENPVLTRSSLEHSEAESIDKDLLAWITEIEDTKQCGDNCKNSNDIFANVETNTSDKSQDNLELVYSEVPVRGAERIVSTDDQTVRKPSNDADNFVKHRNPNHIKSWEYDKWSKFNVDEELTKLEIEDMRQEELEEIEHEKSKELLQKARKIDSSDKKTIVESKSEVPSHSKNTAPAPGPSCSINSKNSSSNSSSNSNDVFRQQRNNSKYYEASSMKLEPSYIEEIPEEKCDVANLQGKNVGQNEKKKLVEEFLGPMLRHTSTNSDKTGESEPKPTIKEKEKEAPRRFRIMIEDLNMG